MADLARNSNRELHVAAPALELRFSSGRGYELCGSCPWLRGAERLILGGGLNINANV